MTEPKTANASQTRAAPGAPVPLVVDLDGTLSRTDTLHEALLSITATQPALLMKMPTWLSEGRAAFKSHVADNKVMAGNMLPIDHHVVTEIEAARAQDRPVYLVSAADQRQVDSVADALGLFDEAVGSHGGTNLRGDAKADYLTLRFGVGGFDYIGDAGADLAIWKNARQAITVGVSSRVLHQLKSQHDNVRELGSERRQTGALLRAIRPHQWSKNLLVFLPMAAAHDFTATPQVLLAFIAFCMMASSAYLLNDLLDLEADRAHPRKRKRPLASGAATPIQGLLATGTLIVAATAIALVMGNPMFLGILWLYLVSTLAYSFWLKRKTIIDILTLAALYTIRIIAGGVAASIVLSPWMLGFSVFLFLALAAVKRQTELVDSIGTGRDLAGRGYLAEDLPIVRGIALSAINGAIVVLALYISSDEIQALYDTPALIWGVCPLLLYWLYRMVMKSHRGEMDDDPIVFAMTDRISLAISLAAMALVFAASA
ncbi:MAG: UbiA family prenyltransferase [Pseudomonadota bacterium]